MTTKAERLRMLEQEHGIEFLSRLGCLIEAVNLTCDKAEEYGINTETSNLWIKPIAFHKYIDERQKDMLYNMKRYFENDVETKDPFMDGTEKGS